MQGKAILPYKVNYKQFYQQNIRYLNINANGYLVDFVDCFQGLDIMHHYIDSEAKPEDNLIIQMLDHIRDHIYAGTCETI